MSAQAISTSSTTGVAASASMATTAQPQQRFYALDLVRLVAMLFMMQGHVLYALVSPEHLNIAEFPWNIWHFVRGLTAPIFLLTSGAVHVFANKRDAEGKLPRQTLIRRLRWAVTLIGIGYLMVFPANRIFDLPYVPPHVWTAFFRVNILQLTGIALALLTIVISLTRSTRAFANVSVGIGVAIVLLSPFVEQVDWFAHAPEGIAAYLSYAHGSIFPIFPFASYLFFGVAIGRYLQSIPSERRAEMFPRFTGIAGGILVAVAFLCSYIPFSPFPAHTYHLANPAFVCMRIGLSLLCMSGIGVLYRLTQSWGTYYSLFGKKALHIYVGHLVLLYGTPWFRAVGSQRFNTLTVPEGIAFAVGIIAICLTAVYVLHYYQNNSLRFRKLLPYTISAALAYALLV